MLMETHILSRLSTAHLVQSSCLLSICTLPGTSHVPAYLLRTLARHLLFKGEWYGTVFIQITQVSFLHPAAYPENWVI